MKKIIYKMCASIDPSISPLSFSLPTSLTEVLLHVEEVEATINLICLKLVPLFKPREIPNDAISVPNERFETVCFISYINKPSVKIDVERSNLRDCYRGLMHHLHLSKKQLF